MTRTEINQKSFRSHESFEPIEARFVQSLNVQLEHYRHKQTGADHFHIAADNEENVFMVALRTMPKDSTGVAHILEHTALCGSEKYPVRDPFFMMTRRSLNTFMNAMTSSDWTAYPFASENKKDYENLLDVYLDAVFFSNLNELDFLQEGHRVEFEIPDDPTSKLVYKGVVFNEMKGAMSSPVAQVYQSFRSQLFPSNTYHYNSGGDPEFIPDLTYDKLKKFYKTHYHPSNATFFSFGNRPAADIQQRVHQQALHRFKPLTNKLTVALEKRFSRTLKVEDAYGTDDSDLSQKTYLSLGWLLGESSVLSEQLEAHLLSDLLFDNSSSPLRKALETSSLGTNPSPLCGLDDSNREMLFMVGLEGSEVENATAFETLVIDTLQQVVDNGIEQAQIDAMLHQLELSQREITGDSYPYGLQLIFSVVGAATHGGPVMESMDIDAALEDLRQRSRDPQFIPGLIKKLLLDNRHRILLTMRPDNELNAIRDEHERARLDRIQSQLSEADKQRIIETSAALKQRQEQIDDSELLPKVTLTDVKPDVKSLTALSEQPMVQFVAGTNGLAYQQYYWPLPELNARERQLLPLYTALLTELGAGEKSYLDMQQWQAAKTGSVHVYSMYKPNLKNVDDMHGYLIFSGKALNENVQSLNAIMKAHWTQPRFDELDRILDYLTLMSSRRSQGVTGNGHGLAMQAASAAHSPGSWLTYDTTGLPAIARLNQWVAEWNADKQSLKDWVEELQVLHAKLLAQPAHGLLVGEQAELPFLLSAAIENGIAVTDKKPAALQSIDVPACQHVVWSTSTQVNFCASAFKTVAPEHADSAALTVLAGVLRNNYLHRTIREQGGAYGAGASHDNSSGVFRFYSYRDPRLDETFADFDGSLRWLQGEEFNDNHVEEAILGVISSMDKPGSPAGEAKLAYQNQLFDRTTEFRRRYRERLLAVTKAQLVAVAKNYLQPQLATKAVITSAKQAKRLQGEGFEWFKLTS